MNDLRRRFRRRFAIFSTVMTVAVAAGVCMLIVDTYWGMLTSFGERRHGEIAKQFYDAAAKRSGDFLGRARAMGPAAAREHAETSALATLAQSFSHGTRTVRLAILDHDGYVLFSTARAEIGTIAAKPHNLGVAREGEIASSRFARDGFSGVDGTTSNRKLFESLVPVQAADGRKAIVSVYSDVTGFNVIFEENLFSLLVAVVGGLFGVLGMLIFFVGRDRMLTEQQQKNAALTETVRLAEEASRLKSRFVASMGHELRTPLNAVIGFSEAMTHKIFGPLSSPKYEEYAATIHASGRHLLAVVDDVLDMARIEGGKAFVNESIFSIGTALTECGQAIALEAARHGLAFDLRIPDRLPDFRGDEAKIKQILFNLLANAMRYTPRGGSVALAAERRPDGGVAVSVTDTGIGIPADQIGRLFEPFRQADNAKARNAGGLGLGLSIAKAFADLHEASLSLESAPGRGTAARLVLPGARCLAARSPALSAAA